MDKEEYYKKEVNELLPFGQGDVLFYSGILLFFTLLFLGIALGGLFPLLAWLGIVIMAYGVKYDWKRVETSVGRAGNVIALVLLLFFILFGILLIPAVIY